MKYKKCNDTMLPNLSRISLNNDVSVATNPPGETMSAADYDDGMETEEDEQGGDNPEFEIYSVERLINNIIPGTNLRQFAVEKVKEDGLLLSLFSKKLRATREVVTAAVEQNGDALQWASDELKADRGVMMAAVPQWQTTPTSVTKALP